MTQPDDNAATVSPQRVLITGVTSGLGEQLAHDYLARHWHVSGIGRNPEKITQLTAAGIKVFSGDLTDEQTYQQLPASQQWDVVILNAGTCEYIDDPLHFDAALFHRVIETNVQSLGYSLHYLLPHLAPRAKLVFISSSVTWLPLPRAEAYGASKAAVDYLAKSLRLDLCPHGIDVLLVKPGFIKTPLTDKNTFPMPGIISVEAASAHIIQGIEKNRAVISFPTLFILSLKLLQHLPERWLARLLKRT
ncbi:Serine 3-dehydrogenase [Plesiomonas shigelloides]|uniref:SDR family NAD(P)-dependent oxidoreductase n=1 Tax=Plesiomonas shigelloides TaxID=703 RepID=UPI000DFE9409|nr:SDR family NAD(P)-dependent oxidoreductase [Plesiomonas shigelloides]SUC49242.1 Serine 3-dehydrogenase [Plesiomonas shigelloides]